MWIDSHCHVTAEAFDADRDRVLDRARSAGVEAFIAIGSGYGLEHNERAVQLAEANADVFATVGVHPHEAASLDDVPEWKPFVLEGSVTGYDERPEQDQPPSYPPPASAPAAG